MKPEFYDDFWLEKKSWKTLENWYAIHFTVSPQNSLIFMGKSDRSFSPFPHFYGKVYENLCGVRCSTIWLRLMVNRRSFNLFFLQAKAHECVSHMNFHIKENFANYIRGCLIKFHLQRTLCEIKFSGWC